MGSGGAKRVWGADPLRCFAAPPPDSAFGLEGEEMRAARVEQSAAQKGQGSYRSPARTDHLSPQTSEAIISPPSERSDHLSPQRAKRVLGGVPRRGEGGRAQPERSQQSVSVLSARRQAWTSLPPEGEVRRSWDAGEGPGGQEPVGFHNECHRQRSASWQDAVSNDGR